MAINDRPSAHPIVHVELHTGDLTQAEDEFARLFGWRSQTHSVAGASAPYVTLELGEAPGYGMVECPAPSPRWLPYVEVEEIHSATSLASSLGGTVLLSPREGPSGWRAVVSMPGAGEVALWQPKR